MRPSAGAQFDLRQRVMAVLRLGHAVARHVTGKEIWKSLIECVDRMRSAFGSLELRIPGRVCFPLVLQLDAVAGELDGTMSCSIRPDLACAHSSDRATFRSAWRKASCSGAGLSIEVTNGIDGL
jgi:hypothetical protein